MVPIQLLLLVISIARVQSLSNCLREKVPFQIELPKNSTLVEKNSNSSQTVCLCKCQGENKKGQVGQCTGQCTCSQNKKDCKGSSKQLTSRLLLIRPKTFSYNHETADDNPYQQNAAKEDETNDRALVEFDALVKTLRDNHLDVMVLNDTEFPKTPDAIFPNWHSFHYDPDEPDPKGIFVLYPMLSLNRRQERKPVFIEEIKLDLKPDQVIDLSGHELDGEYLEATGSVIYDRVNKIIYSNLSKRTSLVALIDLARKLKYTPVTFQGFNLKTSSIYHTDLMMSMGSEYILVCLKCISNPRERKDISKIIKSTGKHIIEIDPIQVDGFAANQIQVENKNGEKIVLMSETAQKNLNKNQLAQLSKYNDKIVTADLKFIELIGGGSLKCMITEIHLP